MGQHLVFYDGNCGLCDKVVQTILRFDKNKIFVFAPLQGTTANKLLKHLPEKMKDVDSLILIENYQSLDKQYYIMGKAALKIAWDLKGFWRGIGVFFWLPSFLYDWIYRLVAKNRLRLFPNTACVIPTKQDQNRFLP